MSGQASKLLGDSSRGQYQIHIAGGNGAARHARIARGTLILGNRYSTLLFNSVQTPSSIRSRTGQNDSNGAWTLLFCDGSEEAIDRQMPATRFRALPQTKGSLFQGHLPIGRHDVNLIGL